MTSIPLFMRRSFAATAGACLLSASFFVGAPYAGAASNAPNPTPPSGQYDQNSQYNQRSHGWMRSDRALNRIERRGEKYVNKGKLDRARAQLRKLERRCGQNCKQYQDLSKAIERGSQPQGGKKT